MMEGCFTAMAGRPPRVAWPETARSRRLMGITAKGVNRASEHGTRSPVTWPVNIEEVEEIDKGKEVKQSKEEGLEKKVDSKVKGT